MNRDEYIESVTVGGKAPLSAEIILCDYNPQWPMWFETEAQRIKSALGGKVLELHHVGSTSVPKLCAKPIIDILLTVENSANEPDYVPAMEKAGYILRIREPDWHEHRMFKGPKTDINLHVFSRNSKEAQRMLLFRNWLRNNDKDRALYADTKRNLASKKWTHVQHYADAKSAVVEQIISRALLACDCTAAEL